MTRCQLHFHLLTVLLLVIQRYKYVTGTQKICSELSTNPRELAYPPGGIQMTAPNFTQWKVRVLHPLWMQKAQSTDATVDDCHLGGRGLLKPTGLSLRENRISSATFFSHFRLFKRFISYSLSSWMAEK